MLVSSHIRAESVHGGHPTASQQRRVCSRPQLPCIVTTAEQAGRERAASEAALAELQARLPGPEWKERHGAAGVGKHEKRGSPMVELSLILVRRVLLTSCT